MTSLVRSMRSCIADVMGISVFVAVITGSGVVWCSETIDAMKRLVQWSDWCNEAIGAMKWLVQWSDWCNEAIGAMKRLVQWSDWCNEAIGAMERLVQWSDWCNEAIGAMKRLVQWSDWCDEAIDGFHFGFYRNAIIPDECKYRVAAATIEITLRKRDSKKWTSLEAPSIPGKLLRFPASSQQFPVNFHNFRWDAWIADKLLLFSVISFDSR